MKRRSLILGLASVPVVTAACGTSQGGTSAAPAGPPVPIEYWEQRLPGDVGERFVKAATTFNQQQTRAVLSAVPVPAGAGDLRAKLLAASAGGAGPDVMLHNALEVSSYLGTGLLYDLDTALKSNKE